jgi:hypothetical protein
MPDPWSTKVSVPITADGDVTSAVEGIIARNYGSGALSVTANGDVEGTSNVGIYARNSGKISA